MGYNQKKEKKRLDRIRMALTEFKVIGIELFFVCTFLSYTIVGEVKFIKIHVIVNIIISNINVHMNLPTSK